ncbi:MAG: hypothetical protein LH650_04070, partial [Chloroflexi bacterium]|nr:hypothetical protein [Chloroflexota bacterium]
MLLIGAVLGLVVGLLAGGRLDALLYVRLRYLALLMSALILRFRTQIHRAVGVGVVVLLRLPVFAAACVRVPFVLGLTRPRPGLLLVL